jgi:hypothetical protein
MASLAVAFDQALDTLPYFCLQPPPISFLPFRASSRLSSCTQSARPAHCSLAIFSTGQAHPYLTAHETYIPNSLAMLAASATRSLL